MDTLAKLGSKGNTLVVVEHDDYHSPCQHVIELGAGTRGGRVVARASAEGLTRQPESITGFFVLPLRHRFRPAGQ